MYDAIEKTKAQIIRERVMNLKSNAPRQWGIMDASQMMAHLSLALENCLGKINFPPMLPKEYKLPKEVIESFYNDIPFGKNGPTDPNLIVEDKRTFDDEKQRLLDLMDELEKGGNNAVTTKPHSFFGYLTVDQWTSATYKHIDHHLKQFDA